MQEPKAQLKSSELLYEPESETVAGFIADMSDKVDELLLAANWRPTLE